jgi:hypothetical protein
MRVCAGVQRVAFGALNRVVAPLARSGVASLAPIGPALVVVDVVGRRSHRVRSVPLLALRFGSTVLLGTIRPNSQWLANVDAARGVAVWLGGDRRAATADIHRGPVIDVASVDLAPNRGAER